MDEELTLYKKDEITGAYSTPDYSYFVDNENEFELIEEATIDIESIKEIKCKESWSEEGHKLIDTVNELVQAVKQLNKEIKSIREK